MQPGARRREGDTTVGTIVFGQLELPDAAAARELLGGPLHGALEFDQQRDDELLRLDVAGRRVRLRAWMLGPSLRSWWPRLHALALATAQLGGGGEVWFVGTLTAWRLHLAGGRLHMTRVPAPEADHPALIDVALLVEERAVRAGESGVPGHVIDLPSAPRARLAD